MVDFEISRHAIDQYRARVIACPERPRSDEQLRDAIREQLQIYPMSFVNKALVISAGPWRPKRKKPWGLTLLYPAYMFVIEGRVVVTTLGFMMRPNKKTSILARRRRSRLYADRAAALPLITAR